MHACIARSDVDHSDAALQTDRTQLHYILAASMPAALLAAFRRKVVARIVRR